jgi:hypothetical protein
MKTSVRVRLTNHANSPSVDPLQILAISAGSGNGWEFSEAVLRESMPLWQGVECFIDHAWNERSVRDLAGLCVDPCWEKNSRGIRVTLKPVGPAAELLQRTAAQMVASSAPLPDLGFSADLLFNAEGTRVSQILQVFSVDLVVHPARGGKFLKPNPTLKEKYPMEEVQTQFSTQPSQPVQPAVVTPEGDEQRMQMCASLLESTLAAAQLPESVNTRLRDQFGGRLFNAPEFNTAVQEARQLISELSAGSLIQGAGRVSEMTSPEDQISAPCTICWGSAGRPTWRKFNRLD